VSQLSRKCGTLDVSQPYGPSWPVTGIALPLPLINNEKSLAIGFHHKNDKNIIFQDIIIKDRQIKYAFGTKFLGIWLDKNLTWDFHIDNLVCKLSKLCCALRTSRKLIDDNVARIMYYAYFYPVLKYGIVFWGV
jgi:hypothetical protein